MKNLMEEIENVGGNVGERFSREISELDTLKEALNESKRDMLGLFLELVKTRLRRSIPSVSTEDRLNVRVFELSFEGEVVASSQEVIDDYGYEIGHEKYSVLGFDFAKEDFKLFQSGVKELLRKQAKDSDFDEYLSESCEKRLEESVERVRKNEELIKVKQDELVSSILLHILAEVKESDSDYKLIGINFSNYGQDSMFHDDQNERNSLMRKMVDKKPSIANGKFQFYPIYEDAVRIKDSLDDGYERKVEIFFREELIVSARYKMDYHMLLFEFDEFEIFGQVVDKDLYKKIESGLFELWNKDFDGDFLADLNRVKEGVLLERGNVKLVSPGKISSHIRSFPYHTRVSSKGAKKSIEEFLGVGVSSEDLEVVDDKSKESLKEGEVFYVEYYDLNSYTFDFPDINICFDKDEFLKFFRKYVPRDLFTNLKALLTISDDLDEVIDDFEIKLRRRIESPMLAHILLVGINEIFRGDIQPEEL